MIWHEIHGTREVPAAPTAVGSAPGLRVVKRIHNTAFKMPTRAAPRPTTRK